MPSSRPGTNCDYDWTVEIPDGAGRRELQERLAERSRLLELSYEPIFAWHLYGGITEWNAGCEHLYGYSRAEAIGHVSHDLLHTVHPMPVAEFLSMIERERQWQGELRHRTRDGREVIVESRQQLIDTGGRRLVLETNRDITDRKRAAARAGFLNDAGRILAGSLDYETTLRTVANLAVPTIADWAGVDVVTESGKLERLAVAHVDADKVALAKTLERYVDPNAPTSVPSVVRTGTPALVPEITTEMLVAAAHGDEEYLRLITSLGLVSYMCVPLVAHGRAVGALTLATAESRRHYSDDDLQFALELAHRAGVAVDNAQAYRAMLVADRLKDEFLATLSHELRTPLNAILGYARLLRAEPITSEKVARSLGIIERNAAALTQLVDDVLDVSRIISGKVRLNVQSVDVPAVVRTAVDSLLPAAEAKQLKMQAIVDPDAGPITGDPSRLQQIVWNLVSNAVKFTPKGGRIQVRVQRADSHVEIVVSDTGVGITPEFHPHVFERFRQADSGTTRRFGGLGLGLAIVRHLVELHGGSVEVESAGRDQGATFRVVLPLMIVHPAPAPEERRGSPKPLLPPVIPDGDGKLAGVVVLAVDDDSDALVLVREILEGAGANVVTTDSGLAAIDLLSTIRPQVVIADVGLPDLDGFDLVRRIRQLGDPALRDTPAIALTAYARSVDRVKALESGFVMHIAKPADPAELVAATAAFARHKPQ